MWQSPRNVVNLQNFSPKVHNKIVLNFLKMPFCSHSSPWKALFLIIYIIASEWLQWKMVFQQKGTWTGGAKWLNWWGNSGDWWGICPTTYNLILGPELLCFSEYKNLAINKYEFKHIWLTFPESSQGCLNQWRLWTDQCQCKHTFLQVNSGHGDCVAYKTCVECWSCIRINVHTFVVNFKFFKRKEVVWIIRVRKTNSRMFNKI